MFSKYILILIWIGFMGLLEGKFYRVEYNSLTTEYEWRAKPLFSIVVMLPVIWMAGFKGYFIDTYIYIPNYQAMPESFAAIPAYMLTVTKDKGFSFVSAILRVFLGRNYIPYLFSLALFHGYAIIKLFRKYSTRYVLSVFLFIASTDYISWMFNGLRQFTAVSILILATSLMIYRKPSSVIKKYLPLVLVVLIASTMHQSALIMLPFIIISQGEVWNKKTILFILASILAIIFVDHFTDFLDSSLQGTQYANMVSDYLEWDDNGTNPIRVLVYSIPAIFAFIGRSQIRERGGQLINFCANMSIISAGLYLVSMVTSGVFLGRLPIYCSLYGYILLPWELDNLFSESNKKMIKFAMIVGYLGFYYYGMHVQYNLI